MARIMPELEFRSFHSHRSCENVPNTTLLATLPVPPCHPSPVTDPTSTNPTVTNKEPAVDFTMNPATFVRELAKQRVNTPTTAPSSSGAGPSQ